MIWPYLDIIMIYLASLDHPHGVSVGDFLGQRPQHGERSPRNLHRSGVSRFHRPNPTAISDMSISGTGMGWENVRKCLKCEVFHRNI